MIEFNANNHAAMRGKSGIIPVDGAQAAGMIASSTAVDLSTIGFDQTEASRLGVKLHEMVSVTPDDNGASLNMCLGSDRDWVDECWTYS